MAKPNPITDPKQVFLEIHGDEAAVFRAAIWSPAFKLAMATAMAEFMTMCPTQEQCAGAMSFRRLFEAIGEVQGERLIAKGPSLSQSGRDPMPPKAQSGPQEKAPSAEMTTPTQPQIKKLNRK